MKKILFSLIFLTGCYSNQKLAVKCADKFPVITEVKYDTIVKIDTINIRINTIDTFYIDTTIFIKEIQKVESTARLEAERLKYKKEYKRLYDADLEAILDLNKRLDKYQYDTIRLNKSINKLITQNQKLKERLYDANKFKYIVIIISLFLILFFVFYKWFKSRLF